MAQALTWSHEALADVNSIAEYISRDSAFYAQQVVVRILELAESLTAQPRAGRVVPELGNPDVRERFVYSYRMIYELRPDTIHILAVIHGKRLLDSTDRFGR